MTTVSLNNDLALLITGVNSGSITLKAAKAQVMNLEIDADTASDLQTHRTKAAFIADLEGLSKSLESEGDNYAIELVIVDDGYDHEAELAKAGIVDEDRVQVTPEPTKFEQLDMYADSIKSCLDQAQQQFMYVGETLTLARDCFESQKDFLLWARDICGIQKTQVYNLMKVYKRFGANSIFNGIAMRVLYTLSMQSDEVVAAAEELAQDNELDSRTLNNLIDSMEGKNEKVEEPTPAQVEKEVQEAVTTPEVSEPTEDNTCPFDVDPTPAPEAQEVQEAAAPDNHANEINCLLRRIDELTEELNAARTKTTAQAKAEVIIELPQFSSDCMYARLGLSVEDSQSKAAINKAYRALAKIYSKTVAPNAAERLLEARTALLADAK